MPHLLRSSEVTKLLKPGMRVFLPGLASESSAFRDALQADPGAASGITFCGAVVPGVNIFDYASLHPTARVETLFMAPMLAISAAAGKVDHLPLGYHTAFRYFSESIFDLVVLHVAPPDDSGMCSLGITSDFADAALSKARQVLAIVNPLMPTTNGRAIKYDTISFVLEQGVPLSAFEIETDNNGIAKLIAANVASLIHDGDCLQFGLGRLPSRILASLTDRKQLTVHSGLVTDAILPLLNSGSIALPEYYSRSPIVTNAFVGTSKLYERAVDDGIRFANVGYTHALETLSRLTNFVSINSAIEVDLFGQINSETIGNRPVSGIGGASDFIRGANAQPNGRAIVALPSVTASGESRLVACFQAGTPVTVARSDGVIVVTENGIADLRGISVKRRAEALIEIANPNHQDMLTRAFFT